ncbi:MAG: hypothetical protein DRJ33_08390 [Candidatus Methanomethylicota archaeon]|uniref:Uncharacterized protein n=1 Tax=Thermoproteota archaeon TaxID=2056631 RepID=A0A497EPM8_9CREN|nr:MAG: hypothetical protein DRJ33_08390 [Candidatus Verstraetearchaeota archaeon]
MLREPLKGLYNEIMVGVFLPRRAFKKSKKRGHMYFSALEVSASMPLKEILNIVFTDAESYKEIAAILLEYIKRKSAREERGHPGWVTASELSNYINERLTRKRRSAAYKVLSEYLVPMGFIEYSYGDQKYMLSREFAAALRRLGEAYVKWLTS